MRMDDMRIKQFSQFFVSIIVISVLLQSCIFSPDKGNDEQPPDNRVFVDPTTPKLVIQNIEVSFNQLEYNWYERCLHENFFWESPSKVDELDLRWGRTEEVQVIENLLADCTQFIFTASEISSYEEWGSNLDNIPQGYPVSEEHPNEVWYVYNYLVTMDIFTKTYGDFQVRQDMKFKIVQDAETKLYSIIRWIDETPE